MPTSSFFGINNYYAFCMPLEFAHICVQNRSVCVYMYVYIIFVMNVYFIQQSSLFFMYPMLTAHYIFVHTI